MYGNSIFLKTDDCRVDPLTFRYIRYLLLQGSVTSHSCTSINQKFISIWSATVTENIFIKWGFNVLLALHTVNRYQTVDKQIICLPLSPAGNKDCSCSTDKVVTGLSSRSSFSVLMLFEALIRNTHFRMCRRSPAKFVCNWSATPAIHTNRRWTKSSLDLHGKEWHIHKIQHTVCWTLLLLKTAFNCTNFWGYVVSNNDKLCMIWEAKFSAPVQTGPGAQPASYTMEGRGGDHPPPSSTKVKERVELYFYSPSGPSWPVTGLTLLYFTLCMIWGSHDGIVDTSPRHWACGSLLTWWANVVCSAPPFEIPGPSYNTVTHTKHRNPQYQRLITPG